MLRTLTVAELATHRHQSVDAATLQAAGAIVDDVRSRGEVALRHHAERLGDLRSGQPLLYDPEQLRAALEALPVDHRRLLERTAERIRRFAEAQKACLVDLRTAVPGGFAGHSVAPVESAGCYAPGGRFPLPSSVLMTAVCARAAGVARVWVASPRPAAVTLAAAAVAGADALLACGGAQAIAALAYGAGVVPACDAVVGPGNRWVTAAKQLVAGQVAIDMLAGPSELVVFADPSADAATVASDLLAQAEHDPDALPVLVTTSSKLLEAVNRQLESQLAVLPTASTARPAVANGYAVLVDDVEAGIAACDRLAPEHLELMLTDAPAVAPRLRHYGALFIGSASAEVLGDYGAGPNHVLPTAGTARFSGGLSVFTFLRVRTWLEPGDGPEARALAQDAVDLARLEGLEGHARSAQLRLQERGRKSLF